MIRKNFLIHIEFFLCLCTTTIVSFSLDKTFFYCFVGSCNIEALDVVFGIDMSSTSRHRHQTMTRFLLDFSDALQKNTKYLNLGALKYGSEARVTFPYRTKHAATAFSQMVNRLDIVDNGRAVDAALAKAYDSFFKPRYNQKIGNVNAETLRKRMAAGNTDLRDLISTDGRTINRRKLFVLLVSGSHIDNGGNILPVHTARLLYDLGVQIMVVAFDDIDTKVRSIAQNPNYVFEFHKGKGIVQFMDKVCNQFESSKYEIVFSFIGFLCMCMGYSTLQFYFEGIQEDSNGKQTL